MSDRRGTDVLREIMVSAVVPLLIGGVTGYTAIKLAEKDIQYMTSEIETIQDDVSDLTNILMSVQQNQRVLAERGVWMTGIERRLTAAEKDITRLEDQTGDRYTAKQSERDLAPIREDVKELKQTLKEVQKR